MTLAMTLGMFPFPEYQEPMAQGICILAICSVPRLAEPSAAGEILPDGRTESGIFTRNLSDPSCTSRTCLVKVPGTLMRLLQESIPVNSVVKVHVKSQLLGLFSSFILDPNPHFSSLIAIVSCRPSCVVGA